MDLSRHRKLIFGLYLIALGIVVVFAWRVIRRPHGTVAFTKIDVAALNDRSARRAIAGNKWPLVPETPPEWREYVTNEEADVLLPNLASSKLSHYDPWMYMIGAPNRRDSMPWPEHPSGRVRVATNSVGLCGTKEYTGKLADLRVLVAGDSHTFGVCNPEETFSSQLQGALGEANKGQTVEVLNAGCGGYTYYNYVGTILRWRERKPKVMVVAVFAGNDFAEAIPFFHFFAGEKLPEWTPEQLAICNRGLKTSPDAMGQGLYSAYLFFCRPQEVDRSVEAGIAAMQELRAICEQLDTKLVLCFLPTASLQPFDPPVDHVKLCLTVLHAYGFEPTNQQNLEEHFVQRLRDEHFELLDMRPIFAAEPSPPFWRHDLHLSLRGHELVAKALEPIVQRLLGR